MDFINLFCLFCVILICFAGICPNMMRKKKRIFFESKTRSLARPVPNVARPCLSPPLLKLIFFPSSSSFKQHNLSHLQLPSLNLHNPNLQTPINLSKNSIKPQPPNLHNSTKTPSNSTILNHKFFTNLHHSNS